MIRVPGAPAHRAPRHRRLGQPVPRRDRRARRRASTASSASSTRARRTRPTSTRRRAQEIRRKRIKSLPTTLADATAQLRKDAVLRDWFGHTGTEHYSDYFADTKLREFQEWHSHVSLVGGRPLPDAVLGAGGAPHALGRRRRPSARRSRAATSTRSGRTSAARPGRSTSGSTGSASSPASGPTPAHDHGAEEEIFYVLAGSGLSWRAGETHEVRAGRLPRLPAGRGRAHAGRRRRAAGRARVRRAAAGRARHLPRARRALGGAVLGRRRGRGRASLAARGRGRAAAACPNAVSPRPDWIVHRDDVAREAIERPGRSYRRAPPGRRRRVRARPACSHVAIAPGAHGWPRHCHASDEELFVILGGSGTRAHRRRGGARARRARRLAPGRDTALAHSFRAGPDGLEYLAYGQRQHQRHQLLPGLRQGRALGRRRDRPHRAARLLGRGGRAGLKAT